MQAFDVSRKQVKSYMKKHNRLILTILISCTVLLTSCKTADRPVLRHNVLVPDYDVSADEYAGGEGSFGGEFSQETQYEKKSSYMIYYGALDRDIIENAKQYELVILHPRMGNITREQVQEIRSSGTIVLGYISIGEDLRTAGLSPEDMLNDSRYTGDKTGPRVDPRTAGDTTFDNVDPLGKPSDAGVGYASYYLDDNDHNGKPDINPIFNCAFTNIGDPAWYDVLLDMTIDGEDGIPGIREILDEDYGRGLGCDGLFLDTIDTCAPNSYTSEADVNMTRFEWTATGVKDFTKRLKKDYPDKYILQNRGIFFYNPYLPHYKYNPRHFVDYVMYESFMLDSNSTSAFNENYYGDNRYNYAPKLMAEAERPDGFQVLSLGYAEGPEEYELKASLMGNSEKGLDLLLEDMKVAENETGFMHYITDGGVTLVNNFVLEHQTKKDKKAPHWTSVYNDSTEWPPGAPTPRIGIGEAVSAEGGITVRWDVALDKNGVEYVLYYQKEPFDLSEDPELSKAESVVLKPKVGDGYENGDLLHTYPFQDKVTGLEKGTKYYLIIRARDRSKAQNEEGNAVVLTAVAG